MEAFVSIIISSDQFHIVFLGSHFQAFIEEEKVMDVNPGENQESENYLKSIYTHLGVVEQQCSAFGRFSRLRRLCLLALTYFFILLGLPT
jgi:hypothetical protein